MDCPAQIGQTVQDLTGDFDTGIILDIYPNTFCGPEPVTMLTVDFGEDQIFDRLLSEVTLLPMEAAA